MINDDETLTFAHTSEYAHVFSKNFQAFFKCNQEKENDCQETLVKEKVKNKCISVMYKGEHSQGSRLGLHSRRFEQHRIKLMNVEKHTINCQSINLDLHSVGDLTGFLYLSDVPFQPKCVLWGCFIARVRRVRGRGQNVREDMYTTT